MEDTGKWFLIGVAAAGLITALVPESFIEESLGPGLASMLLILAVAVPLYVCATASTPIVAALAVKGLSPGAALVFLLAGPATNAASLAVVARILGRRGVVAYLSAIVVCSLGLGILTNHLYLALAMDITGWAQGASEEGYGIVAWGSAAVLTLLIARALWREYGPAKSG